MVCLLAVSSHTCNLNTSKVEGNGSFSNKLKLLLYAEMYAVEFYKCISGIVLHFDL